MMIEIIFKFYDNFSMIISFNIKQGERGENASEVCYRTMVGRLQRVVGCFNSNYHSFFKDTFTIFVYHPCLSRLSVPSFVYHPFSLEALKWRLRKCELRTTSTREMAMAMAKGQ